MFEVKQGVRGTCPAPAERYPLASGYAPCKGSEFVSLPAWPIAFTGPRRAASCGRLSLLTFFGEAKKVSSRRAEGVCACKRIPFRRRIACDPNSLLHPPACNHEGQSVLRFRRERHRATHCAFAKLQALFSDYALLNAMLLLLPSDPQVISSANTRT